MAQAIATPPQVEIRPFRINVRQAQLDDLRMRIAATRWPDHETVMDSSQGLTMDALQALARHWESGYDWRRVEAKLNALPQFTTEIDGLDIHFIHVRSKHAHALPVIVTHGWPGSVVEQLKIITVDKLKAFFATGVFYALEMATRPQTLYGLADSPVALAAWLIDHGDGDAQPAAAVAAAMQRSTTGRPPEQLTRDDVLDNITLYWLTNTGVSAARIYCRSLR